MREVGDGEDLALDFVCRTQCLYSIDYLRGKMSCCRTNHTAIEKVLFTARRLPTNRLTWYLAAARREPLLCTLLLEELRQHKLLWQGIRGVVEILEFPGIVGEVVHLEFVGHRRAFGPGYKGNVNRLRRRIGRGV